MKYERLVNNYNLPIFLRELDKMKNQECEDREREKKLRFIRHVSLMFHLKLKCLRDPDHRTAEWKEIQYVNMMIFFGSRDVSQCEKKLKLLISTWRSVIPVDKALKAQTPEPEVSLAGEE